jgi:hypothetical protein
MADESEADNADGLGYLWRNECESLGGIAFEIRGHIIAFNEHGDNNNNHPNEGKAGCTGQLMDITIEGERI